MSTGHEGEMIRRAAHARAQRRAAREQLLAIKAAAEDAQALPVKVVAQHDWTRKQAALVIAALNAAVQVLVRVFL